MILTALGILLAFEFIVAIIGLAWMIRDLKKGGYIN